MPRPAQTRPTQAQLQQVNAGFYDMLWSGSRLTDPCRFNTWPLVRELSLALPRRLEVAPGLRPRLPLDGTVFVDLSHSALARLHARGARAARGVISALPCADAGFDLVCALDILEHVVDDDQALRELARVSAPGAWMLLSLPLHPAAWTDFDELVGHYRRYEPEDIARRLATHGWRIERSAIYGMQSSSPRLLGLAQHYLTRQPERATWWYDRVFMPLGLRLQRTLHWRPGLGTTQGVDEVLLLCRRVSD
ncbi:class I SAM-dependent methyltransferase [Dyella soli]|uniref:Methyltransferase domain-containing protein n=1 Tax=Dyella soli TaxID=522319 RepID=A0A4R0YSN3_9GAMM|nr:methyltransferase domain-containing protein [Dyella soli]TCI11065.1 methyltransferase domain-containing protein [Dyella soli]